MRIFRLLLFKIGLLNIVVIYPHKEFAKCLLSVLRNFHFQGHSI